MATRFESFGQSSSSSSSSVQAMDDDIVYVAVGNEVEESKPTLLWVLQNFGGRVHFLHVHQLSKTIRSSRHAEHQKMHKILDAYVQICIQAGMPATKLLIEMDDIGEGIVELIYAHDVKKLVMGAAANKHYSGGMTCLKSKKAMYVNQHVPPLCKIWFICNGHCIHTREGNLDAVDVEVTSLSSAVETGPSVQRSPFLDSGHLGCSSSEVVGDSTMIPFERTEEETIDQLVNQLRGALLEASKSKREAYEESVKRAEKTATDAIDRARAIEISYTKERRRRTEIEEELAKQKEDRKQMRNRVASCEHVMKGLNEMAEIYKKERDICKKERDDLQRKHDNEERLRKQAEEASSSHMNQFFSEFSVSEIEKATRSYHSSLKIGEGGYGSIYQGSIRQTEVAIKLVHQSSLQRPLQFEQEVNVLSKLRHPKLVTLIGVCPEISALIYEYLPNGSLKDQLCCRDTPPLLWQTRIRIATDLCSVLIFLHSSDPCVVHANLRPGNILLDANFACKLSDFGSCRALTLHENSINGTDPQGNFPYLDPQFLATGELSPKSDIYSFGIILLQLLTGRSPLNIANDMRNALAQENLNTLLDPLAGDWPVLQARQLAYLAVRCCDENRSRRPDLVSEVWDVLERMRESCEALSSFQPTSADHSQPPSYFTCPISQDVMEDPHMAGDGFTYELEYIRGWLNSGVDTSPITRDRLPHRNLVPNRALRSAIQDWRQQHSNVHS